MPVRPPYNLGFTATSLRLELARVVAEARAATGDWEAAREHVLTHNALQAGSASSAIRMERELRQRLRTLTDEHLRLLISAPADSAMAMAWLSVCKYSEEFKKLDRERQARVLAKSTEARATITQARFMAAIRDRIARYHAQDYPAQLDLAAKLAAPSQITEQPDSTRTEPRYVPVSGLKVSCRLPYIASEADLDQWLRAMRQAAVEELLKGNRISL